MKKKDGDDYWKKRKKMTEALEGGEIKSAHVPFRNLDKFASNWKSDKLEIVEIQIDGMYSRTHRHEDIPLTYMDEFCYGGFSISHSSNEVFRWNRILKSHPGTGLDILSILRKLQLPFLIESASGKSMRIVPKTLYLKRLTIKLKETGQVFQLKGKVPKGLLREQAKKEKVTGDLDTALVVLDVYNGDGSRISNPKLLKDIGDCFPHGLLYYRICKYEQRDDVKVELECKEIWNSGNDKLP